MLQGCQAMPPVWMLGQGRRDQWKPSQRLALNWYVGPCRGFCQLLGRESDAPAAMRPRSGSFLAICGAHTAAPELYPSSCQESTEHRGTLAFILQTSLQPHLSGSALPLPLHLVFCCSPWVAVNLHFVLLWTQHLFSQEEPGLCFISPLPLTNGAPALFSYPCLPAPLCVAEIQRRQRAARAACCGHPGPKRAAREMLQSLEAWEGTDTQHRARDEPGTLRSSHPPFPRCSCVLAAEGRFCALTKQG